MTYIGQERGCIGWRRITGTGGTEMEEIPCEIKYAAEGAYPEIRVQKKNWRYGQAILSNVGGSTSEMSAVARYLYGYVSQEAWGEVSDCLRHIAVVEMRHLDIFSQMSRQLGEDPRLWTLSRGQRRYWTPEYLRYPRQLEQVLCLALEEERMAIQKYTRQAMWIQDENIRANLWRIIADEEVHVQILTCLIESYRGKGENS